MKKHYGIAAWPRQQKNTNQQKNIKEKRNPNFNDSLNRKYQIFISGISFQQVETYFGKYLLPEIRDSKWPSPKTDKGEKNTCPNLKSINIGRYRRIVTKTGKGKNNKTVVTEQILDFEQKKVEWSYTIEIQKKDVLLFIKEYNKSPLLKSYPQFELWQ